MFVICQNGFEKYSIKEIMEFLKINNNDKGNNKIPEKGDGIVHFSYYNKSNFIKYNYNKFKNNKNNKNNNDNNDKDNYNKNNNNIYNNKYQNNKNYYDILNGKMIFPHHFIINYEKIFFDKNSDAASNIANYFLKSIKDKKIDKKYIFKFYVFKNDKKLSKRVSNIYKKVEEIIKKKVSRVYKLKTDIFSDDIEKTLYNENYFKCKGLVVIFKNFNEFYISDEIFWNGQKRMKFDNNSPSRSYLKIEEAFFIFKLFYNINKPELSDIIVDIGAAPGGWSYSMAKNRALVFAVDNGPLKKGALNNQYIYHLKYDGFKLKKEHIVKILKKDIESSIKNKNSKKINKHDFNSNNINIKFLLCDMIEKPEKVLSLIDKWIKNRWCKYFIINLKFGEYDPFILKQKIFESNSVFNKFCEFYKVIHLFHDREEITILGKIKV